MLSLDQRLQAFINLGNTIRFLQNHEIETLCRKAANQNGWFDTENVTFGINAMAEMLSAENLNTFVNAYPKLANLHKTLVIGVVAAGNIPMVGFHDAMCVLLAGHKLQIKLSSSDTVLMLWLLDTLQLLEPAFVPYINVTERLVNFDGVIATGSDNTGRYFQQYFGGYPNIIRSNRTSVAVLDGNETPEDLAALGEDIFRYYGLGCRNVSSLMVPVGYNFVPLLDALQPWAKVLHHHKYNNNYDYNKSLLLVNRITHLDAGFLSVTEDTERLVSPISVLYFREYDGIDTLDSMLATNAPKIQAIVANVNANINGSVPIGKAQQPQLLDFADGVDTINWLINLTDN